LDIGQANLFVCLVGSISMLVFFFYFGLTMFSETSCPRAFLTREAFSMHLARNSLSQMVVVEQFF